jgi:hypothetical protein
MMNSTTELISMLDREESELVSWLDCDDWNAYCDALGGADSTQPRIGVGIVVRSEKGGSIVWGYDKDRQAVLDSLVKDGGEPIGMIKVSRDDGKTAVESILFDEYVGDPSAKPALSRICREFGKAHLRERLEAGYGLRVRYFADNEPGQWEDAEDALLRVMDANAPERSVGEVIAPGSQPCRKADEIADLKAKLAAGFGAQWLQ